MQLQQLEVGKWYYVELGYSIYIMKCLAISKGCAIFKLRFHGIISREEYQIHGEAYDPSLSARIVRFFKGWVKK